jgi:hypothetical protein
MRNDWYWEYAVKIWESADSQAVIRTGIISTDTLTNAVQELVDYYGDEILEIQMLKCISEGPIFEFETAAEVSNYFPSKKE